MINSTGWVFVAIGVALAGWAGYVVSRGWRARHWPAAPGQVVSFVCSERRGGRTGQTVYTFELRYRYVVGGAAFEGRRVGFGVQHVTPPGRPALGMPVTVYYDPRDPGAAVLRRDVPAFEAVCGLVGLALAAAGFVHLR